ncbi:hypothetical protein B0T17DRAFT_497044 [Bombardia bombarda]|uniref:Uncharacterized protein n=1 Tax=Bombardia bombarda TaxID=252184 RepID=A0AA39WHQ8_9PEZI|nr:hypothetical protein B0T17DRAFT_497044 [Bombardia bombarda]
MEASAPKRRKTSPHEAIQLPAQPEASTTPRDPPAKPPEAAKKRPSFASPTKASLERHNPEILRRRESSPKKPDETTPLPASRPASPESGGSLSRALAMHFKTLPQTGTEDNGAQLQGSQGGGGSSGGAASQPGPSKTAAKPDPRPLPPPAPEDDDEEEILNPFKGHVLARSPIGGALPDLVEPEPELPPTPEHPDPVVSTPPSGIHNTPSKRPRRSRALAERLKSSSPLKQPPLRPPTKTPAIYGGKRTSKPPAARELTTSELRGLQPKDPDATKKKLRDSLLVEVAELERDLELATQENERIRLARLSKREPSPPANKDDIFNLLRRHVLPPEKHTPQQEQDPSTSWIHSMLNPIAFLPFSKQSPTLLPPPSPTSNEDDQKPPTSHHPLPMTAAEALPYLQVFTPLSFTSHISPLPQPSPSSPLLQRHTISAASTSPRGLFSARIEMTVNTTTMAVSELAVPRLDPAAVVELTPFIQSIVTSQNPTNSALTNNVSVLAWAMGEWLRVATQRAKVWCALERELHGGREALEESVAGTRRRAARRKKRKRRRGGGGGGGGGGDDDEEDGDGGQEEKERYAAGDLLPFMGSTSMDFEIPVLSGSGGGGGETEGSTLRVQWRIDFDWTGEARSIIAVLVGVPGKWHKCDERGQLSGIPKLFDDLIQGGEDPLAAVRTVVSLLAGEQR